MSSARRPNFLWISFEDTNPFYGCYGDPTAKTPSLDRLATEGCVFTNCYSTAGVCAPARSAIITGMYPISIGTHHMRTTHTDPAAPDLPTPYSAVVPHYVRCFTEYLRAAGYYCTNNAKTDYQFDPPITAWDELSETAHWRNRPNPEQPFFAVFNPMRTHESGMWKERRPEVEIDPATVRVPPYFPDTPRVRESLAKMHGNIARSDAELGELLAQLEEDGLAENTIVMHWSDHGPLPRGKRWPYDSGIRVPLIVRWPRAAGNPGRASTMDALGGTATVNAAGGHLPVSEHADGALPGPRAGRSAGERPLGGSATGPLRGFDPGDVADTLVSTVDLGPTLLSLAGPALPRHLQGRVFLGPDAERGRDYVFASRDRYDTSYDRIRACRDRRYKYIRHYYRHEPYLQWIPYRNEHPIVRELLDAYRNGRLEGAHLALFRDRPAEELYDTAVDPYELANLADDPDHRETLERMRAATDQWIAEVGDYGEMSEREMVARWYPNGEQPVTAAPIFLPIADGAFAQEAITTASLTGPALVQLHCSTQGASIAYRFADDPTERWRLYSSPFRLEPGRTTISARAQRIGYAPSETVRAEITVE
ncbi:MAG: sulfatase [Spirochaetota bacterium]